MLLVYHYLIHMYASEVLEFYKGDVIEKNTFGIC